MGRYGLLLVLMFAGAASVSEARGRPAPPTPTIADEGPGSAGSVRQFLVEMPDPEGHVRYLPPALDEDYAEEDARGFRLRIHGKGVKMRLPLALR